MAQKEKRKVQESIESKPGDFTPPYMRGVRDALAAVRRHLDSLQFEDHRKIAAKLSLPYLAVLLMIEGSGTPVDLGDVDQLNGWLDCHELSREQVFGNAVGVEG